MSSRLAVVFCVGIACAGCSTAQTKADRFIKAGDGFVAEGRNYAAAIQYLNAIKQTPDSSSAYRKLGLAHLAAGDAGAAYRSFTKAVDLDPADVEPRLDAARLLLRAGLDDLAQVRAEQVLEREPGNLDAQLIAARALAELRQTDEALARLSLAHRHPERGARPRRHRRNQGPGERHRRRGTRVHGRRRCRPQAGRSSYDLRRVPSRCGPG